MVIKRGKSSLAVKKYQTDLLTLGYDLPKWGADGSPGNETFLATEAFTEDHSIVFNEDWDAIPVEVVDLAKMLAGLLESRASVQMPACMVDHREEAKLRRRKREKKVRKPRKVADVTGITLHQTATHFNGRCPYTLEMHYVVQRNGESQYINDVLKRMAQAQNVFNSHDVGIECDGYYSGVGTNMRYFWKPRSRPNRKPMVPTDELIYSTRETVEYICEEIGRRGGEIKFIHAHRQTSRSRASDPGSLIWRGVGVWAQDVLGLSDGGKGKTWLSGKPIPESWDPKHVGIKYG